MYGLRRPQRLDRVVADRADRRLDDDPTMNSRARSMTARDEPSGPGVVDEAVELEPRLDRERRPPRRSRSGRASRARSGRGPAASTAVGRPPTAAAVSPCRTRGRSSSVLPPPGNARCASVRRDARPRSRESAWRRIAAPSGGGGAPSGASATATPGRTRRRSVGARRRELEQRPVDRVEPRRDDPDPPEPEGEDRVLLVAGVVGDRPVAGDRREVRLAGERPVERRGARRRRSGSRPRRPRASARRPPCRPGRGSGPAAR